jgi:hypothetical protein
MGGAEDDPPTQCDEKIDAHIDHSQDSDLPKRELANGIPDRCQWGISQSKIQEWN